MAEREAAVIDGETGAPGAGPAPDADADPDADPDPDADRRAAFTAAYRCHLDDVWRYVRRRVPGNEEADDVTAEVFATAWRRRADLPPDAELRLWLFGTARRVLANHHRSARRRDRLHRRLAAEPPPPPPQARTPAAIGLWQALASLTPEDRDLLIMRAWDELAVADVAVLLGCTPNAASLRLRKARGRLADALALADPPAETDPPPSRTSPGRSPAPEGGTR